MLLPRFYPILDTGLLAAARSFAGRDGPADSRRRRADSAASSQGFFFGAALDEAGRIAELCRAGGAVFVVNDRADIAALLNAGLHLGQEDLAPSAARLVVKTGVIGFSTHNALQLRAAAAEPADYLAIGPIFATASKENPDPVLGLDELRRLSPLTIVRWLRSAASRAPTRRSDRRGGRFGGCYLGSLSGRYEYCRAACCARNRGCRCSADSRLCTPSDIWLNPPLLTSSPHSY